MYTKFLSTSCLTNFSEKGLFQACKTLQPEIVVIFPFRRGCECPPGHILIERDNNGTLLHTAKCLQCTDGAQPNKDQTICQPCFYSPILKERHDRKGKCNCTLVGGLCLPPNFNHELEIQFSKQAHFINFPDTNTEVDSAFFKEHMEASAYMCWVRQKKNRRTF